MSDLRVALTGDDAAVRRRVDEAGWTVVPSDAPDADALVTVGERALVDAALSGPAAPLLPVVPADAGAAEAAGGRHAVRAAEVGAALDAVASGDAAAVDHPVLAVSDSGERVARALFDVSLITSEPAGISEYSVRADDRRLDGFRADGVVVATPLGSAGYARATGGPLLEPGTGLAVVPVSPFATRWDARVVDGRVRLRVERDDTEVSLVADDRVVRPVSPAATLDVTPAGSVELLDVGRRFPPRR
ncbi:NAD(+)/NADH kinase [Candidatus Halobonum tyrrellensis]|uniref:ATP-NAD kinase n=1 Tax=Candidatus Halobonum tyrrellensis G22 TaxID=1324957 RepID=V4HN51_9EURY|nr:NAD(+)/NADH kinase [Candidatus Halobonum tyrrellensis]ESP89324.1 ATP-NAD kinase [Candidatus Halobonum tyrrellensis G22]